LNNIYFYGSKYRFILPGGLENAAAAAA